MKNQINLFLTALMFYTRLPIPIKIEFKAENLNRATKYLPLIGLFLGLLSFAVFYIVNLVFSSAIAVFLSIATTILLTGAFHEDGFADTCDAFGGGWTIEKKLSIMKDSCIGTYGTVGLISILGFKFLLLTNIPVILMIGTMVLGHTLSRWVAVLLIFQLEYVQDASVSKSKPIGKKNNWVELFVATVFSFFPMLFFSWQILFVLPVVIITNVWFVFYLKKQVGGYTGDCLGAAQQITEVIIYLTIIGLLNFSLL